MKNQIKVYRAKWSITQEELADKLGISRYTVLALEKEKYVPSLDLAFRIARFFKTTVEDMFQYE
jgi:putative transcriptional regulator